MTRTAYGEQHSVWTELEAYLWRFYTNLSPEAVPAILDGGSFWRVPLREHYAWAPTKQQSTANC